MEKKLINKVNKNKQLELFELLVLFYNKYKKLGVY